MIAVYRHFIILVDLMTGYEITWHSTVPYLCNMTKITLWHDFTLYHSLKKSPNLEKKPTIVSSLVDMVCPLFSSNFCVFHGCYDPVQC